MPWFLSLFGIFANILTNHSSDIVSQVSSTVADGTSIFNDIAHGEGGVQKLEKVANDLATLAAHAGAVLGTVKSAGA